MVDDVELLEANPAYGMVHLTKSMKQTYRYEILLLRLSAHITVTAKVRLLLL